MPNLITRFKTRFLKDKKPEQSSFTETGASGVTFFDGMISGEEYLTDLQGSKGITIYDRMRRSDAQVRGTLNAITLPIRQAKWFVDPASDESQDIEIAERLEKNLFEGMSITWDDFLRQALNYLTFGFSMFEEVLKVTDDNLVLLDKLAPRLQKTLNKWLVDDHGELQGMQQYVKMANGSYQYIDIPEERLLLFVNEQEGSNFEGISILRSSYKHWYIKDQLYQIDSIGHDRWSSGIPWLQENENANKKDKDRAATVLKNLHSREKSYMFLPFGWDKGIFEKTGSNESIIKSIQHHNEQIAVNVLAQFVSLGSSNMGSLALGESFEELFMQNLNAVAGYIADVMNRKVIRPLVDLNWNVKDYPTLKASRIMLNINRWLEGLAKVGLSNGIKADSDIENILRDQLGFPELSPEVLEERETMRENLINGINNPNEENKPAEQKTEEETGEKEATQKNPDAKMLRQFKRKRKLTELEKALADFDIIEGTLNNSVDKFTKQIMKIKRQQAEYLSTAVLTEKADDIVVPYVDKLAARLYDEQKKNARRGAKNLRDEVALQKQNQKRKDLTAPELLEGDDFQEAEDVDGFLKDKSKADSVSISNKTLGIALFALYNMDPTGKSQEEKEKEIFGTIMTTGNSDIERIANASVNKAYSLGREVAAGMMSNQLEYAVYSAVLDQNLCSNCAPKDGVTHAIDDPNYQTPNPDCEGGDQCRCINIYKVKGVDG